MMERKSLSYFLSTIAVIFIACCVLSAELSCAGMTPPMGGPRDSLPPMILRINPKDSTLNFKGKKIEIEFNEFVQLQDLQQNLLVSPTPKVNPTVEAKLRTISVTIRDTLEENTTYALDFGNAIRDYNEGNALRDYRYIFSTGNALDSLELAGRVIVAQTGKPDSTLVVMLHTRFDDSAIVKEKPRYVARVDSSGYFRFHNLAPGRFAIYAIKDESGGRRYFSSEQLLAFSDSSVTSQSQQQDIMLYAFQAEDTSNKSTTKTTAAPRTPSRRVAVNTEQVLRFQTNIGESKDLLTDLDLIFSDPLRAFDSTKILLTDTAFKKIDNYYYKRDTSDKMVSIVHKWQENTMYNLIVDTSFAEDTLGRRIASIDTLTFETKKTDDYGLVRLRFLNLPLNRNPVLQFVQADEVKYSHVFTNNEFFAPLFIPGDYDLRLVFDENKNGKWDTGNFFGGKRQPEKVQLISRKLNVKPRWDTEVDIQL